MTRDASPPLPVAPLGFGRKLPELQQFKSVEINLHYLNGDDKLRDQAALFWNASLLIWPHGATMALTIFLPQARTRRGQGGCWLVSWDFECTCGS